MTKPVALTATRQSLFAISLLCVAALAADVDGLRLQSETKITAQLVGAPFEGDKAPFVWAMSFSPDGKSLALGIEFTRKAKAPNIQSYLVLVSPDRPNVVLAKFATPTQVELGNLHSIVWGADGKFLAVTPWGDWDHAALVDVDARKLHVFPDRLGVSWCGGAEGVVSGPRMVQRCFLPNSDGVVRFLDVEGHTESQRIFHGAVNLLRISPDRKTLALDLQESADKAPPHQIVVLDGPDWAEVRRWLLPDAVAYAGTFAAFGKDFCTVGDPNASKDHEIVCSDMKTGEAAYRLPLAAGTVGIGAAGDKLIVSRSNVVMLPFSLFDSQGVSTVAAGTASSAGKGPTVARWPAAAMNDLNYTFAVSESGESVAIADSAKLRVYRVLQ